jgi:hypothetical protein
MRGDFLSMSATNTARTAAAPRAALLLGLLLMGLGPVSVAATVAQQPQPLRDGDLLSGELLAVRMHANGKRVLMFQLTSEPRRIPGPDSRCNLEVGPETFELVTRSDAEVRQLKAVIGKTVSIRVGDLACAHAAGQVTDALISKWSIVQSR